MQVENTSSSSQSQVSFHPHPIRRGQVYTAKEVIAALKTSRETLDKWCSGENGLKRSQKGTKSMYYLGDHLIDFLFGE